MPDAPSPIPDPAGATPAMAQWFALKQEHPDALLFLRMGDFYELFFADAQVASAALDITLTQRGEHAGRPIPMCGVPVHAADAYLARLIRRGFRVAVAEQTENPKTRASTKTPIRRAIVRLVTPGTLTEETLLDAARPNLLLALAPWEGAVGAAWLDVSTGLFETDVCAAEALPALLGRLDPAEIVAPEALPLGEWGGKRTARLPAPPLSARRHCAAAYGVASLDAFGAFTNAEAVAAWLAIDYVRLTQAGREWTLGRPAKRAGAGLRMDAATRASLDILRARDGGALTLFAAIDRTLTAAGARLLALRLADPLSDPTGIAARQEAWAALGAPDLARVAEAARAALRNTPDLARALSRIAAGRHGPRDLGAIRDGLAAAERLAGALADGSPAALLAELAAAGTALIVAESPEPMLRAALAEPAPARLDDGGAIRAGFDGELDAERALRDDTRRVIAALQMEYAQRYGVASLKIRHHAQLGYVVEAPSAAVEALRAHPDLILRQGMANGARFATAELADLDRRVGEAGERAAARERAILDHLAASVLAEAEAIGACAAAMAAVDVAQSAASLAARDWCRPVVTEDAAFRIVAGRHPVVEAALPAGQRFIANDCDLSPDRRLLLLTGPNMAGKSTFLRQNALLVILAQAGLPVPAEAATIGVVDQLFSRVGAADDLARGRSTFMVEMTETAAILNQAGPRALVVIDEVGRGTSTLDGLAIAWAVLEALHSQLRCRTLFATHFHELAGLSDRLPCLKPHTMRVRDHKGTVVFLHEVAEGAAGRSWGVHVAELAGVPAPVVRRAAALLASLEQGPRKPRTELPLFAGALPETPPSPVPDELHTAVAGLDPDAVSPRDALEILFRLKAIAAVAGAKRPLS